MSTREEICPDLRARLQLLSACRDRRRSRLRERELATSRPQPDRGGPAGRGSESSGIVRPRAARDFAASGWPARVVRVLVEALPGSAPEPMAFRGRGHARRAGRPRRPGRGRGATGAGLVLARSGWADSAGMASGRVRGRARLPGGSRGSQRRAGRPGEARSAPVGAVRYPGEHSGTGCPPSVGCGVTRDPAPGRRWSAILVAGAAASAGCTAAVSRRRAGSTVRRRRRRSGGPPAGSRRWRRGGSRGYPRGDGVPWTRSAGGGRTDIRPAVWTSADGCDCGPRPSRAATPTASGPGSPPSSGGAAARRARPSSSKIHGNARPPCGGRPARNRCASRAAAGALRRRERDLVVRWPPCPGRSWPSVRPHPEQVGRRPALADYGRSGLEAARAGRRAGQQRTEQLLPGTWRPGPVARWWSAPPSRWRGGAADGSDGAAWHAAGRTGRGWRRADLGAPGLVGSGPTSGC